MAKECSLLKELIEKAHLMEDSDWESLANKGILRRAKKDLIKEKITTIKEEDDAVTIIFKTYKIRIPGAGFPKASCSCPAVSMCHHIVMCGLYLAGLKDKAGNSAITENIKEKAEYRQQNRILDMTLKELIAWSGIQNYRKACEFLDANKNFKIEEKGKIKISFPSEDLSITCFYDSGPDGMIIPGNEKTRKMTGIAAVLAYRKFKGKKDHDVIRHKAKREKSKKTTDLDFINSVHDFIEDIMNTGLNRLTEIFLKKCTVLSISARAVHMPGISRFIESIKNLIVKSIESHAAFNADTLFLLLSELSVLAGRIVHDIDNKELRGVSRTDYPEYDNIQLSGLGCHTWQTLSGFLGITAYFLEEKEKRILTWSDVRSRQAAVNFFPAEMYKNTSIWNSGVSLYQLVRSSFMLKKPRINKLGRISLSQKTTCHDITANSSIDFTINPIKDWKFFFSLAYQNVPLGLKEYHPQKDIVIIHPDEWCKKEYNPVDQEFYWWLKDQQKNFLCLKVRYTGDNSQVLDHLKFIKRNELKGFSVLGKISRDKMGPSLYPVSFINLNKGHYRQINIGLDYKIPAKKTKLKRIIEQFKGDLSETFDAQDDVNEAGGLLGSATLSLIRQIESELLKLAEKGTIHCWSHPSPQLESLGNQCITIGLPFLGKCIRKIFTEQRGVSTYLLFCRYLTHLHIQASSSGI